MPEFILDELLRECLLRGGTAVSLRPGMPPRVRIDGDLVALEREPLAAEETRDLVVDGLSKAQRTELEEKRYLVFDHSVRILDGTFVAFRAVVGLAGGKVLATFCRFDRGSTADAAPKVQILRQLRSAGTNADREMPDEWDGSPPVGAPVLPRSPVRVGGYTRPIPMGDLDDDNLFAR